MKTSWTVLLRLSGAIVIGVATLMFAGVGFSMGLLPEPTIWINGKLCMKGEKRVAVSDMSAPGKPAPTREVRVRQIWHSVETAKFSPVNGFVVSPETGNPLQAIIKGEVVVKVGHYWGVRVTELRISRDGTESKSWKIDVDHLRQKGESLPTSEDL